MVNGMTVQKEKQKEKTSPPEQKRFGYVLNVLTGDKPGIIAGLASAIHRQGGNIDACNQTVLDHYFTLIMTVALPENPEPDQLERDILSEKGLTDCQIQVRRIEMVPEAKTAPKPDIFVVTAYGKDCGGIVLAFSRYLADKEVNIIDLFGNRFGNDEFLLISQVEVDARHDIGNLQLDLEEIGRELGFTVKFQHKNIFVATNQLRLER